MLVREHFRPTGNPVADPANVVTGDEYRITLLTDGLVRLEWSASGEFEDRASQAVVDRAFPPTEFHVVETGDRLTIHTARLQLVYDKRPFSTEGLSVQAKGGFRSDRSVWRFGLPTVGLGGTARTLDNVDGPVPLEPGILSRDGVTCYDDSRTVLLTDDGWIAPRRPDTLDLYVFAYGRDYRAALRAFYRLTGPQPLLPRFALGNWWSRYHAYSADEYLGLMDRFAAEGIPLSRRRARHGLAPRRHRPPPRQRLDRLHLEPRALPRSAGVPRRAARARARDDRSTCTRRTGVHAHEERLPGDRAADGRRSRQRAAGRLRPHRPGVPARPTSRCCTIRSRREGVDFWWLDWQQGGSPAMPGLDPLWLLNHFHFLDAGADDGAAAADVLPLRRARQPPLPDRLLRRHGDHLGVAGLPAVLHRDRDQRRLRLVEPRRRRPHLRLQGRRARHPLDAVRRLLADHPAALHDGPFNTKEPWRFTAERRAAVMTASCGCATGWCPTCTR